MKKYRAIKAIGTFALAVLFAVVVSGKVLADEQTGSLVFNSMQKMQETYQTFQSDVRKDNADLKAAIAERETVKKKYKKARAGSLDKKEFHARYSYAQAKIYRALGSKASLTHQVAGKQFIILTRLYDSVISGKSEMSAENVMSMLETTKPILENGKSLLISLAQCRDKITDPVINSKLNAAYDTARMMSNYMKHIENGSANKYASQSVLKQKIAELIEQYKALYVQTDIYIAMIRDKATVLKMINQLAASEAAILAVSDGNKVIAELSKGVMSPLMDTLNESDEDLNLLIDGVLDSHQGMETPGGSQKWTNPNF